MKILAILVLSLVSAGAAAQSSCPTPADPISTDRPDVTNSASVIPSGSLQIENGLNYTRTQSSPQWDGSNTRVRLGVADCTEILVDLPDYSFTRGDGSRTGFSAIAPAVKRQIEGFPGDIQLSVVAGAALPTGNARLSGSGVSPYLQVPWSKEIAEGWAVNGMLTATASPAEHSADANGQVTLSLEREVGEAADVFVEVIDDMARNTPVAYRFNTGGAYHITPLQQLDLHLGWGLNQYAPKFFIGVGYSFRFDRLFAR